MWPNETSLTEFTVYENFRTFDLYVLAVSTSFLICTIYDFACIQSLFEFSVFFDDDVFWERTITPAHGKDLFFIVTGQRTWVKFCSVHRKKGVLLHFEVHTLYTILYGTLHSMICNI